MAWQFDCPEKGEGLVQAFRRDKCGSSVARFKLRGLDERAIYIVTDLDTKETRRWPGQKLMQAGLPVTAATRPAALLFRYRTITQRMDANGYPAD
jgi:alpha-galactosidase